MATGQKHIGHLPDHRMPAADRRHALSITQLAQELALPLENVAARYEAVLHELMVEARIADYLPILAAKRVRAHYKRETEAQ
jgi:ABC-type hemin transport system ATPase subunit